MIPKSLCSFCIRYITEGEHPLAVRMMSGCQQAVKRKNIFCPNTLSKPADLSNPAGSVGSSKVV